MKALVTGATGFIGSHVVEALKAGEWDVRVLVRKTSDLSILENANVEKVIGDVRDADSLHGAVKGVDAVFHAAALVGEWGRPSDFYAINVTGMENMIRAATEKGPIRFIDISSSSVHGYEGFDRDTEELPYRKTGVLYSDTKMEAEQLLWKAHAEGLIRATSVRPVMVWGPRDRAFMTKIIFALKKRLFCYVNGGRGIIGLAHVSNVCDVILRAATCVEAEGKAFIVTDDCDTTLRGLVEALCEEFHLPRPRFNMSYSNAKRIAGISESFYRRMGSKKSPLLTKMGIAIMGNSLSFDISRAKTILEYKPRYRFPQGLQQFHDWFRSEYGF